ncbi:hypothetical protein ABEB36_014523 [Hypothenemus hampei]|uniref:Uncharacterized protein n=1 Tax=Hypothenemus hampei TaxID=57062 RepID=A0ABD1E219_HYPHA
MKSFGQNLLKCIANIRVYGMLKVQDSKRTGAGGDVYEPNLWYYDLLLFTVHSETGRKGQSSDEQEDFGNIVFQIDNTVETELEESTDAPTTPLSTESESDIQRFLEKGESKTPQTSRSSSQSTFRSQKKAKLGIKAGQKYCNEQKKKKY